MLSVLLPYISQEARNEGLSVAIMLNKNPQFYVLLATADPKFDHSKALEWACLVRDDEIMARLYPVSDVKHVHEKLKFLSERPSAFHQKAIEFLEKHIKMHQERDLLDLSVDQSKAAVKHSKKI